jgi:hypothetical protein
MHIFDRLSLGPAAEIAGARPLGNGALVVLEDVHGGCLVVGGGEASLPIGLVGSQAGSRASLLGNGALVVQARAARAGNVQVYRGDEVARPDLAQVRATPRQVRGVTASGG